MDHKIVDMWTTIQPNKNKKCSIQPKWVVYLPSGLDISIEKKTGPRFKQYDINGQTQRLKTSQKIYIFIEL